MTDLLVQINNVIYSFVWGPYMLALFIVTGVMLTIATGCIQVSKFNFVLKNTWGKIFTEDSDSKNSNNLTPFEAVSTALAGTLGTCNIAGVTGAIFVGGPGALFWMWFAAFFGMATKYSEVVLAMKYRETNENGVHYGGPMYYISKGLGPKWKWLAMLFAICAGIACFGCGNLCQSTEISGALIDAFGIPKIITGIVLTAIVAWAVLGGVKTIGAMASRLVPFMALFYVFAGVVLILMSIEKVPGVIVDVFTSAFSIRSVEGGFMGIMIMNAMKQGFARSTFSNEAGLGSAPIAHAASSLEEPCEQAIWGIFEVFVSSMIISTISALSVLLSGVNMVEGGLSAYASSGAATIAAFNSVFPGILGGYIIEISLVCFALSTIIGWSYYGERCWGYVSNNNATVNRIFKIAYICMCFIGACGSTSLMWDITDTMYGMMSIPNLIALLLLSKVVAQETKSYFGKIGK